MQPSGFIELTLHNWPWEDLPSTHPYKLRTMFTEMDWWRMENAGVLIRYNTNPHQFRYIPWHNIIALEWKCNTKKESDFLHRARCADDNCMSDAHDVDNGDDL